MKEILQRLQRIFLLSGCNSEKEYQMILPQVQESNYFTLKNMTTIAAAFLTLMSMTSAMQRSIGRFFWLYVSFGFLTMVMAVSLWFFRKKLRRYSIIMVYGFIFLINSFGIVLGAKAGANRLAVTFIVLLIVIPLLFIDRLLRMVLMIVTSAGIFLLVARHYKTPETFVIDLINVCVFALLSIFLSYYIMRIQTKRLVGELQLKKMSVIDLLTGLKNRNSYEKNLFEYPKKCERTLACIYIDVNGLHELNNTKGHMAGDRMLCFVADRLSELFGNEDAYRVGGDEYIVFVKDMDWDVLDLRLQCLTKITAEYNYHISLGVEQRECSQVDMEDLVRLAESRMFEDKERYYCLKGNDRRKRNRHPYYSMEDV